MALEKLESNEKIHGETEEMSRKQTNDRSKFEPMIALCDEGEQKHRRAEGLD